MFSPQYIVSIGEKPLDFKLEDQDGNKTRLPQKGTVALYFYSKDDTPGCTKQACSFRDNYTELIKKDIRVIVISGDDKKSHKEFKEKHDLPFPLLCDTDKEVCEQYGVAEQKQMFGNKYIGINRTTFIIQDGTLKEKITDIDVGNHAENILEIVKNLNKIYKCKTTVSELYEG